MRTVSTVLALVLFGPAAGAEPPRYTVESKLPQYTVVNRVPAVIVQPAPAVAEPRPFWSTGTGPGTTAQFARDSNWSSLAVAPGVVITTSATASPTRLMWRSGGTANCAVG